GRSPQHARRRPQLAVTARHACSLATHLVLSRLVSYFTAAGYARKGDARCSDGVAQNMRLDRLEGQPDGKVAWGSDIAAQILRRFGIRYISLNPGASYRGFHDSLVNHLGNENPGIILCLHEDHSVAIAHGYAKATGEPMACVLHSNVGLLHGMMSLFNAWCDS